MNTEAAGTFYVWSCSFKCIYIMSMDDLRQVMWIFEPEAPRHAVKTTNLQRQNSINRTQKCPIHIRSQDALRPVQQRCCLDLL